MKSKLLFILLAGLAVAGSAFADDDYQQTSNACPAAYQTQVDTEFGAGTSAITTCITKRDDIKNVLNMSTAVLNPKSGISQTLNNAVLMIANLQGIYGITLGEDFKLNIVAHFQGGQFLLTDDAYNKLHSVTTGNPSRATVESLLAQGVHIYMCQNTMRANAWVTSDLIPGVEQVPGGVVALADFAATGWSVITP